MQQYKKNYLYSHFEKSHPNAKNGKLHVNKSYRNISFFLSVVVSTCYRHSRF